MAKRGQPYMSLVEASACKGRPALLTCMPSGSQGTVIVKRRPSTMIRIPMAVARRVDAQLAEGPYATRSAWCRAAIIARLEEAEKRAR